MPTAIIQARLNSTRLPRKAFELIEGKPILYHVITRTLQAVPDVIVATPDVEIAEYALSLGVKAFIGNENDVLDRYYQCATAFHVDDIVRITADNPLTDPNIIRKVVETYLYLGVYDYVSNNLKRTYPVGLDVEVFSFKALQRAWREAKEPYDHEHVTPYIYHHPELFKLFNVENDIDQSYLRWTVDTQEDLNRVREIIAKVSE